MRVLSFFMVILFCVVSFNALSRRVLPVNGESPGGMSLLEGYKHQKLQGIDSVPGEITKKDGLKISYEIGRVTKPGSPRMGGDFTDAAQNMPAKNRKWYKEQTVNGQPMHIAYSNQDQLVVTFPNEGIRFNTKIKTQEDLADALLMIMTYGHRAKAAVN